MPTSYAEQRRKTLVIAVFLFFLLAAAIAAYGYRAYRKFEAQALAETKALLVTVNNAKLQALAEWRVNLLNNANLLYRNEAFSVVAARYLQDAEDEEARTLILNWLEAYIQNDELTAAVLLDAKGEAVLSVPDDETWLGFAAAREIRRALESRQIAFVDFYRALDERVYLAMLIPVAWENQPLGLVFLQIDPSVRLYPLLTRQVTENAQTQSYLSRREANSAVILSPLKFREDAPLLLRAPVGETQNVVVQAALGRTGDVSGVDFFGVKALAEIQPTPDFPWTLTTQIAMSDVYAPVTVNFGRAVVAVGTVIFYVGVGAVLIWRQRLLKYYQSEAQAAETLRKTEEELRQLTRELDDKVRERTEQLRALSRQMADMQERQMKHLAGELHDRIGQNLTAINVNLSMARQLLAQNEADAVRARLTDAAHLAEETVAQTRNLVAEFLPPMLERYGLASALAWYGEQFEARTQIRARVQDDRSPAARLSLEIETGLFRIVQEAMNNVAKHSRASQVSIELRGENGLTLIVADDGIGFDPQVALAQPGHWGFAVMRERANNLGATLEVESAPGAGTKIILRISP